MPNIENIPLEMLQEIFAYLEYKDLIFVCAVSPKLRSAIAMSPKLLASKLQLAIASLSQLNDDVLDATAEQINLGTLATEAMTKLAAMIKSSLSQFQCCDRAAIVRCGASLAASGHLTSLSYMRLRDMELPSEHFPVLARVVTGVVDLMEVSGDLAPLLANLSCTVGLYKMELDEDATRGLVMGLQQGVEQLWLEDGTRVHLEILLSYDGSGRCHLMGFKGNAADIYREEMREWATRDNWGFMDQGEIGGIRVYKRSIYGDLDEPLQPPWTLSTF